LAGLILAIVIAGCAKHDAARSASAAAQPAASVLRISQRNEPTDLDPATAGLPDEFFVIRALSEGLLVPNPNGGAPLPAAAERYDVSPDGLTYTFHLRAGATWSNGEPVTADDFVASFRRVLTPTTGAPKAHLLYGVRNAQAFVEGRTSDFSTVGVRAADPATLVVTLEHPNAAFPLFAASGPWIPVNVRAVAKHGMHWTEPGNYVGNGPFVLAEWRPQQRIVVRKNPRYHDAGSIRTDQIQFVRFDNKDSEERAYRAGQIDATMAVPEAKLDVYERERPEELHRAPLAETRFLALNVTRPPLNDARVRRALSLAIDRETLVALVLHGGQEAAKRYLSPALVEPVVPAGLSSNQTARRDGELHLLFDPATARKLLGEAGFPGGKGFPALELSGWDRNPVLEAIQQMWKKELGVDIGLSVREAKVHLAALHAGTYDIAFVTNLLDVRDPTTALADFVSDAPNNFPHWHSVAFDRLISAAEQSASPEDAIRHDFEAEALLLDEASVAPLYFNTQNWLMSPRVHGWEQDALWTRRYNDVWLDH
jgi:oligopeptide transport system substrate-binding protein